MSKKATQGSRFHFVCAFHISTLFVSRGQHTVVKAIYYHQVSLKLTDFGDILLNIHVLIALQ